jgi:hypothetical protein
MQPTIEELDMNKMPKGATAALLVATALPFIGAAAAHASDDDTIRRGSCSGSTDWKIKVKPDDGGIEVEAEIDSNQNGQTWRWVLRHNGNVADRGQSLTKGPSGSFSVERKTNNSAGPDSFKFRAVHNGEVCVARVTL